AYEQVASCVSQSTSSVHEAAAEVRLCVVIRRRSEAVSCRQGLQVARVCADVRHADDILGLDCRTHLVHVVVGTETDWVHAVQGVLDTIAGSSYVYAAQVLPDVANRIAQR